MEKILLDQQQIEFFNYYHYELKDIDDFIKSLKELKVGVYSDCKEKRYGIFAGNYQIKLLAIYEILMSKKLQKNKEDLKKLGQYVQELGKEIENYEETIKKYDDKEKPTNHEEKMKEFLNKFINSLFDEED